MNPRSPRRGRDALIVLALCLASIWANGYSYNLSDVVKHALVAALRSIDPGLFPGDPFLDVMRSYFTYFLTLVEWIVRLGGEGGLAWTSLAAFAVQTYLYFYVVYLIGTELFDRATGLAAGLLFVVNKQIMGFGFLYSYAFAKRSLGLVLALFAIRWFLSGRLLPACLLAGLTVNVHPIFGGMAFAVFGLSWLQERRFDWRTPAVAVAAFVLPALPMIAWVLSNQEPRPTGNPLGFFTPDDAKFLEIQMLRNKHFLDPVFGWALEKPAFVLTYVLGFLYSVRSGIPFEERHRRSMRLMISSAAILAFAAVFTYWLPNIYAIRLLLFRATAFISVLGLIHAAGGARAVFEGGRPLSKALAPTLFAVLMLLEMLYHPYVGFVLVGAITALLWREPRFALPRLDARRLRSSAAVLLGLNLALAAYVVLRAPAEGLILPGLWKDSVWRFNWAVVFATAWTLLAGAAAASGPAPAPRAVLLGMWTLGLAFNTGLTYSVKLLDNRPGMSASFFNGHDWPTRRDGGDWHAVQRWVLENTAPEDVFITPWYLSGFRAYAHRSPVAEFADGFAAILNRDFAFAWWERMADLGGTPPDAAETQKYIDDTSYWVWRGSQKYLNLRHEELTRTARKYGARFVVTNAQGMPEFPFILRYKNESFAVYEFPAG